METTFDYKLDGNVYKVLVVKKNNKNTYIKIKDDLTIYVTTNYLTSKREVKIMLDNEKVFLHKALSRARKKLEKEDPMKLREAQLIAAKLKQLSAEQVRVGHIYLAVTPETSKEDAKKKEELAKQIKKELDGGMDFSAAVKKYTEDKTALASGGDMILIKGIAPKELDQQAFSLAVGKVSEPIKTDIGWHIIKIKEKRSEKEIGYEDISRDLAQYVAQQKIQTALGEYINGLADKADIKVTKTFEVDAAIEAEAAKRAQQEAKKEAQSAAGTDKKAESAKEGDAKK